MKKKYNISGISCGSCVAKIETALRKFDGITVQVNPPQLTINNHKQPSIDTINALIKEKGEYEIVLEGQEINKIVPLPKIQKLETLPKKDLNTYKPLLLIIGFIAGVSLLSQYPFASFSSMLWMRHFMAGFFLVFAFFKLLNLQGFADSYQMYDVITAKWKPWGYIYPFIELALGISYLINSYSFETNLITIILLAVSSIGVIESNLNKRKIKCACLGDVFNLPMSTVTIIENLTMIAMAIFMLSIR